MEYLIIHLPIIFCMLSGMLLAWSFQIATNLINIISIVTNQRAHARIVDILQLTIVIISTITITTLMFITNTFTSVHMGIIVFIEIWYAMFLFFITNTVYTGELTVRSTYVHR